MNARAPKMALGWASVALVCGLFTSVARAEGEGTSQGDPRLDYMLQCQGCHLADGSGNAAAGVPSMIDLADRFVAGRETRAYFVQVPGVAQAPLDDGAIAALMNWMLENFRSERASKRLAPYTESEVERARAKGPIDVATTRRRLRVGAKTKANLKAAVR